MIYYPLSTLMLAGIREILIISTPQDTPRFEQLLGAGERWGLNLQYAVQSSPDGLPHAFIVGESFIGNDRSALVLGDNLFYGHDFYRLLGNAMARTEGASIFATTFTTLSGMEWLSLIQAEKCCRWKKSLLNRNPIMP